MYANASYYTDEYGGNAIPSEDIEKALKRASRHIDVMTYNRIVGKGFENLTRFQQDIIREVCCQIADFEYENADLIENVLQSYSINGVSMSFGSGWNVYASQGIAIKKDIYSILSQTGLCTLEV